MNKKFVTLALSLVVVASSAAFAGVNNSLDNNGNNSLNNTTNTTSNTTLGLNLASFNNLTDSNTSNTTNSLGVSDVNFASKNNLNTTDTTNTTVGISDVNYGSKNTMTGSHDNSSTNVKGDNASIASGNALVNQLDNTSGLNVIGSACNSNLADGNQLVGSGIMGDKNLQVGSLTDSILINGGGHGLGGDITSNSFTNVGNGIAGDANHATLNSSSTTLVVGASSNTNAYAPTITH